MDALNRIKELLDSRGWSVYKLAKQSGVSQSTLSNMFVRNNQPSLPTLEMICDGFEITLYDFFKDDSDCDECCELLSKYNRLSKAQKQLILQLIDNMK